MPDDNLISISDVPCCPEVSRDPCCESIQIAYRLTHNVRDIGVEVTLVAELERCPGPLALGDVVYSTTLLPGEKVRLYTASRNTRFTYDAEREVNYRHEQSSEETYYMSSMDRYMSDLEVVEKAQGEKESETDFETKASGSYGSIGFAGGGSAKVRGSFDSSSSFEFAQQLSAHAERSHDRSVQATRAANSVQIGEVQSRSHAEGESESAYEASTRVFENKNDCHAVTYFAYQLVKRQTIRFRIKAVLRRVIDPAGDTGVVARPLRPASGVAVLPDGVLATAADKRIEVETAGRASTEARAANVISAGSGAGLSSNILAATALRTNIGIRSIAQPLNAQAKARALQAVDQDLVKAGILAKAGSNQVGPRIEAELSFERTTCLPTQAVVVKGCLDDCNTCEDARQTGIKLDLERKSLENKLLERQIALLDQHSDYRCCPVGEAEKEEEDA